jgi:hypothetical protein
MGGTMVIMLSSYGQGIILNNFFGTILNTAQGIASQLNGQMQALSSNILKALNPILGKSAGAGDSDLKDIDINIWKNLDASEKDLKTRRNVLIKFLDSLKVEKAKPKVRKAKKTNKNIFEKGDCLSLKLINGNYGGAIVLESFINEEISTNLIAFTRINQKSKPTIEDVRNSELLIKNFGKWKNEYFVNWFFPIGFKKVKDLFEVIGKLKIQNDFNPQNNPQNFLYSSFNETIFQIIDAQIEKEKIDNVIINQRKLIDFVKVE